MEFETREVERECVQIGEKTLTVQEVLAEIGDRLEIRDDGDPDAYWK